MIISKKKEVIWEQVQTCTGSVFPLFAQVKVASRAVASGTNNLLASALNEVITVLHVFASKQRENSHLTLI